ncbi:hypothetical protein DFQ01_12146 [Paenibacillus cellulosilyticus]|uniref:Uncharacterized protein n=1 Tax=Paenibacillus cellulosilyticus TaxID=375489 RepID=A0A2V2YXR1_9BACL|nr:hypothetical protein [Paenibacillus cellulosilyticus]PWV97403.1 hypothetical protein DFQ01_12146 [Paenibacillus cellulosilyticus]QKS48555.1 hypothetical protein HUB94_30440 [Paenibacillus cellulosilyticus]
MSIVKAMVNIRGVRPMLMHCFTTDTISLEKKERTGVAGNDPEEWKRSFMSNADGQLFIDPSYVFGCLREAARYTKKGRGSIQSAVAASLQVLDEQVLMNRFVPSNLMEVIHNDPTQPVYVDVRSVRNPATKGRNVRYRLAVSTGWEAAFTIMWDNTLVNRDQMHAVCIDAGALVGLADGRAIGFGRFEITSFVIIDNAQKTTA